MDYFDYDENAWKWSWGCRSWKWGSAECGCCSGTMKGLWWRTAMISGLGARVREERWFKEGLRVLAAAAAAVCAPPVAAKIHAASFRSAWPRPDMKKSQCWKEVLGGSFTASQCIMWRWRGRRPGQHAQQVRKNTKRKLRSNFSNFGRLAKRKHTHTHIPQQMHLARLYGGGLEPPPANAKL